MLPHFLFLTLVLMLFKRTKIFSLSAALLLLLAKQTLAFCPVCAVAVGVGLGLSRWLGVDDSVSGLWIGGVTIALIGWTINWLKQKHKTWPARDLTIWLGWLILILAPLYWIPGVWHPLNTLWGVNKLLLGIVLGGGVFWLMEWWYLILKNHHDNHAYFPYQKVVMPIGATIILSAVFYFITK